MLNFERVELHPLHTQWTADDDSIRVVSTEQGVSIHVDAHLAFSHEEISELCLVLSRASRRRKERKGNE